LREIISYLYDTMIKSLNKGLFKGHIERLVIFLDEKIKKIEFLYEGYIIRRNMGKLER